MADTDRVVQELRGAAGLFGPTAPHLPALRWGLLLAALDEAIDDDYVAGMELIYEGYLVHYRRGRVSDVTASEPETALLAGDVLYARGLHLIAARGDVGAVDLLARLMASCSCLRGLSAPFSDDDALWAYAVGGLAALRRGAATADVTRLFDELDAVLHSDGIPNVRALSRASAPTLGLSVCAALDAELGPPASRSDPDAPSALQARAS